MEVASTCMEDDGAAVEGAEEEEEEEEEEEGLEAVARGLPRTD